MWQPIKTATKGNAVVGYAKKGLITDAYIFNADGTAQYGFYSNKAYEVTHWWDFGNGTTMPPPPTDTAPAVQREE